MLDFLHVFGFTTPGIIGELLDTTEDRFARRLEIEGLIERVPMATVKSGGCVCVLSRRGRQEAASMRGEELPAVTRANLPAERLRHAFAVQRCLLPYFLRGASIQSERALGYAPGRKRPDAILSSDAGITAAVEVEITRKNPDDLERAISLLIEGICEERWNLVQVFSPTIALTSHFQNRVKQPVRRWHYHQESKRWEPGELWANPHVPDYFMFGTPNPDMLLDM